MPVCRHVYMIDMVRSLTRPLAGASLKLVFILAQSRYVSPALRYIQLSGSQRHWPLHALALPSSRAQEKVATGGNLRGP